MIRDCSLIKGRAARQLQNGREACEVFSNSSEAGRGVRNSYSNAEGGAQTVLGLFLCNSHIEVLAISKGGGAETFPLFKGVGWGGGGTTSIRLVIFPFCSSPPHN